MSLLLLFSGSYGTFAWIGPNPQRVMEVDPEYRVMEILEEDRSMEIEPEDRIMEVP